jgi:apolipoprotein N-acyltransferase
VRKIHSSAWRLTLLSALLQIVIFPLPGLYWLSWIAITPLLVALLRTRVPDTLQVDARKPLQPASPWQGFVLGYACGIPWYLGTCYWIFDTMHRYGGLGVPAALLILLAFSFYVGLYHGFFGLLIALVCGKNGKRRALIAAPFLWVAVELARTRITAFPWELLGYSQIGNFTLTRIATLTGIYGLSFEIMLVNSVLAASLFVAKERRKWLAISALGAACVLQSGQWIQPPKAPADHAALLVQPNIPPEEDWTPAYFQGTVRDLTSFSLHPPGIPAGQKFDFIVWPESPSPFFLNDAAFRQIVANVAQQSGTWFLVGAIGIDGPAPSHGRENQVFNSVALVSPTAALISRYDKIHLVPFGEYVPFKDLMPFMGSLTDQVGTFSWGYSREPLNAGGQKLGMAICYESIFPDEIRQTVRKGAQVLVNVSNDGWYGDSGAWKQHLEMTQMRAIENGRWLLAGTNTGKTASIDPYGRIVAATERKIRTALAAPYALTSGTTFYTRHGDWFAYLCAIISLAALAARFLFRPSER